MDEKINIEGYEEIFKFQLAGQLVVLAENAKADKPFLVCCVSWNSGFGSEIYYDDFVTSDYLEAVRKFIKQEAVLLDALDLRRDLSSLPVRPLTAEDSIPFSMYDDITGKVVVIKPEALRPECRSAEYQLGVCAEGVGRGPESVGAAVWIDNIFSGEPNSFRRSDIAGIADPTRVPDWAKSRCKAMAPAGTENRKNDMEVKERSGKPEDIARAVPDKEKKQTEAEVNAACAASIDKAIQQCYQGDYRYDLKTAIKTVTEEFGAQRVAAALAANLVGAEYDGRFSAANKAWAKSISEKINGGGTLPFVNINTHRAVLDGFVTKFRGTLEEPPNKKPSLHSLINSTKQEMAVAKKSEQPKNIPKSHDIEK